MSASLSGSGTWNGVVGGERDFIEHINLNLVTANSCLIKGVHITHIHFFPGVLRRVSQRSRSLGSARLRGAGLAAGFRRGRCLFCSHCWLPPLDYFTAADLSPSTYFLILWQRSLRAAPSSALSPFAASRGGEITGYEGNV